MNNIDPSAHPDQPLSSAGQEYLQGIQSETGLHILPPNDCTPPLYSQDFMTETEIPAYWSQRHTQLALRASGRLGLVLSGVIAPDERTKPAIEALAANHPVFITLDEALLSEDMRHAQMAFSAPEAGLILRTEIPESQYGSKLLAFPALANGNHFYRVLQTPYRDESQEKAIERALSMFAPASRLAVTGEYVQAAVEFLEEAERPTEITQSELTTWLRAVRHARVHFGLDVSSEDESLDNFLRHHNRLVWIDGNIMEAKLLTNDDAVEKEVEMHRQVLRRFVRRKQA